MATYPAENDYSAQADGTTLTNANATGTGNTNYDSVTIGAGAELKFSTARFLPNSTGKSLLVNNLTATTLTRAYWQHTSAVARFGGRCYYNVDAFHSATYFPVRWTDSGGTTRGLLGFTSAGKLAIYDQASSQVAVSTLTLPTDEWFRVEWDITFSTSANPQVRIYVDSGNPHTTSISETLSPTAVNLGATTAQRTEFGMPAGFASGIPAYYLAENRVTLDGFTGPSFVASGSLKTARKMRLGVG